MISSSPITPPPELIEQWMQAHSTKYDLARHAAQWGADTELETCCEWLVRNYNYPEAGNPLRAARRPKPPSLKEQALEQLACIQTDLNKFGMGISTNTIRRALEDLDD
jgi:hypothetical protein